MPTVATEPTERAVAKPRLMFSKIENLPDSGVIASRDLASPHSPQEPLLVFTARLIPPLPTSKVVQTAFVAPLPPQVERAIELARLPQAKPAMNWSKPGGPAMESPLLAYARAPNSVDEPFNAVLGSLRTTAVEPDDGLYRPRPRPDDSVLDSWLAGRSAGQFAPGQHPWVQNPLPASVFTDRQQKCLAEGIYFEARGESEDGQAAVAQVILNRVRNPAYPKTVCGVVYQNETQRHRCQFSFACDGRAEIIRSQRSWKVAKRIASDMSDGKLWINEVGDSTHYHANYVNPRWGQRMIKVDKIGQHIFYRTRFGGWS